MRFEQSVEIEASQQRVWDVLSDLEAWPQRIETVDVVEVLTPTPLGEGSRVRRNRDCQRARGTSPSGMSRPTSNGARGPAASRASRAIVSRLWRKAAPA
jgi:Polyketide cyclase / dehydrase and lipid transport